MTTPGNSIWLPILVPLGLACWISLVLWSIGRLGGWHALATDYRAEGPRPREGFFAFMKSGSVGWLGQYNNVLTVGITSAGLYLAVWPPFRVGHPPLLIPWSAVHGAEEKQMLWSRSLLMLVQPRHGARDHKVQLQGASLIERVRPHLAIPPPPPSPGV